MDNVLLTVAGLSAAYVAIRYIVMKFIVTPALAKLNAQNAKKAFQEKIKQESDEFERLAKEVANAKIEYDRAKRTNDDNSITPR